MDPQHREHISMASRIFLDPFMGVDDQERGFCPGSSGHHVLEKFNVARGIDDDVISFLRLKKNSSRVDRNPLGLFVLQRVDQEGIFERLRVSLAVGLDLLQLPLWQRVSICQESADNRAFAMVHVADDDNIHFFSFGVQFHHSHIHRGSTYIRLVGAFQDPLRRPYPVPGPSVQRCSKASRFGAPR